tara:strand:- start:766 stop:1515 length:750 start_codon:yes stop_codon:yes gene_type:complete
MFKKFSEFFENRKAAKALKESPILRVAAIASVEAMKELGLEKTSDNFKNMIGKHLATQVNKVALATNQHLAFREVFAEIILKFSGYQVLVLKPKVKDPTGLRGMPGITGELNKHAIKIGKTDSITKEILHGDKNVPKKLTYEYMDSHFLGYYKLAAWEYRIFDAIRRHLKDFNENAERDWVKPFVYYMCVHKEWSYRNTLKLKQEIGSSYLQSTFLDIVISGETYPDLKFYETYEHQIKTKEIYYKKNW